MAENQDIQKITAEQGKLEALKADQQTPDQLRKDLAKYRAVYFDELNSGKTQLASAIGENSTFKSKEAKTYLEIKVAKRLSTAVEGLATEGQRIKTASEEQTEYPTLKSLKDQLKSELSHEQQAFSEYRDLEAIRKQYDDLIKEDAAIDDKNSVAGLEGSVAQKNALVKRLDAMSKTLTGKTIHIATDLLNTLNEGVTKTKERIRGNADDGKSLVTAKGAYKEVNTTISLTESALATAKKPLSTDSYKAFINELKAAQEEVNDIYSRHSLDKLKTTDIMFLKPLNNTFYPAIGEPVAKHLSTVLVALEKAKSAGSKEALDPDLQAQLDFDNAKAKIDGFNKEMGVLEKEIEDSKKDPVKYNDRKNFEAVQKKYQDLRKSYDDFIAANPFNQNADKRSKSIVQLANRFSVELANPTIARLDALKKKASDHEINVDKFEKETLNKKVAEMLPKMQEQWKANVEDQKQYLEQAPNFDEQSKGYKEHVAGEDKLFTFIVNCEAQLGFLMSKSNKLDQTNLKMVQELQKLCAASINAITNNRSIRAMKKAAIDTPDQTFTVKVKTGAHTYHEGSEDGKHKPTEVTEDVFEERSTSYKFSECVEFINPSNPKFAVINEGKGFRFLREDLPQEVKVNFELQAGLIITKQKEVVQSENAKKKMEILKTGNLLEMGKQQLGEKGAAYFAALDFLKVGDTAKAIKSFQEYIALYATFNDKEKELHKAYLDDAKAQIEGLNASPAYYEGLNLMKEGNLDEAIVKLRTFITDTQKKSAEEQKKCAEQLGSAIEIIKKINTAKLNMFIDLKKDLEYVEVRRIITNGSPSKADDKDLKEPFRSLMLPYLPYDQLTPAEQTKVAQGSRGLQGDEINQVNAKIRDLKGRIDKGEPINFDQELKDFKAEMQKWNDAHVLSSSKRFRADGSDRPDWPSERLFFHFEKINSTNPKQREKGFLEVAKFMKDEHTDLSDKKLGMRYTQKYLEKAMDSKYEEFTKRDNGALRKKIGKEMLSNTQVSLDIQKQVIDYYNRWAKEQNLKFPQGEQYPLDKPDQGTVQLFQRQIFEQRLDYQYKREVRKKMTDAGEATSDSALELYNWSLPYNDGTARWYKPWSWFDYNQDDLADFKDKAKQLVAETIVTLPIGMGAGAIGKAIGTAGIRMLAAEGLSEAAIMTIERGGLLALRANTGMWKGISTGMKARIMLAYGVGVAAEGGAMITLNSLWEGFSTGRTPEFFHQLEAGEWGKVAISLLESTAKAGAFRAIGASSQKLFGKAMQEGTAGQKILATVGSETFSGFVGTGLEALSLYAKGQGNAVTFDFWMKSLAQNAIQSYGTHIIHGTTAKPKISTGKEQKAYEKMETEVGVTRLKSAGVHDAGDISHISIAPDGSMKSKDGLDIDPAKIKVSALPEVLRVPFEAKVKEAQTVKDTSSFNKGELPAQMIIAAKDGKLTLANSSEIPYDPTTLEPKYQKQVDNIRAAELKKQRPVIEKTASLLQKKEGLDHNNPADKARIDVINKELASIAKERDISLEKLTEVAVKENLLQQAIIGLERQQGQLLHDSKVVTLSDGRRVNLFENFYSKTSAYSGDILSHLDHASLAAEGGSRLIKIGGDELVLYHAATDGSVQKLFIDISNMGPANDVALSINGSKINLVDIYLYKISERIAKLSHDSVGKSLDPAKFNAEVNSVVRELFYIDQDAAGNPLSEAQAKKNFKKLKKEWGLAGEYKDYLASVQAMRYMAEYRTDSRGLDASFKGMEGTFVEHIGKEVESISGMSFAEVQKLFAENQQAIIDLIKARQPEGSAYKFVSPEDLLAQIKQLDPLKSKASDMMPLYNLLARLDFSSSTSPALQKLGQTLAKTRVESIGEPPHSRVDAPRIMDAKVVDINLSKDFTVALHKLSETDPQMAHAILTAARNMAEGPLDKQKYAKSSGFAKFDINDHVEIKDGKISIKPEAIEFQHQVNDALVDKKVGTIIETEKRLSELKSTYEKLLADYREGRIDLETLNKKLPELNKQIAELNRLTTTDPDTGTLSQAYLDLRPSDMFVFPDGEIPSDSRLWHSISTEISHAGAINSKYGYAGLDFMMKEYHEIIQKELRSEPHNLEHFRVVRSGGKFEIIFLDAREMAKLEKAGTSPEKILEKLIKEKAQKEIDDSMKGSPDTYKAIQSDIDVRNSASKFIKGKPEAGPGELTFRTETRPPITAHEISDVISKKPGATAREIIGGVMDVRNIYQKQVDEISVPAGVEPVNALSEAPAKSAFEKPIPAGTPAYEAYKFQRNEKPLDVLEVQRASEVVTVGDLHGNGQIFIENMKSAKIIGSGADFTKPETITWTGGKRRVVFHGDILADRGTDSLQIMVSLRKLQAEARKVGGEVVLISGNHEDMALSFLMGKMIAGGKDPRMHNGFSMSLFGDQGAGLLEFIQKYSGDPRFVKATSLEEVATLAGFQADNMMGRKIIFDPNFHAYADKLGQQCLDNMRKDSEGRKLLEQMASLKVGEYIDDSLFLHTDPTPEIVALIETYGSTVGEAMDKINVIYQKGLRAKLLGEGTMPPGFKEISDAFTNTENRSGEKRYKGVPLASLKAKGVNRIIHGHSDYNGKRVSIDGVEITSVDVNAGKGGKYMDKRSIGLIEKTGVMTTGIEIEFIPNTDLVESLTARPALYESKFATVKDIPDGLPENTVAWTAKDGTIYYNLDRLSKYLSPGYTFEKNTRGEWRIKAPPDSQSPQGRYLSVRDYEKLPTISESKYSGQLLSRMIEIKNHEETHRTLEYAYTKGGAEVPALTKPILDRFATPDAEGKVPKDKIALTDIEGKSLSVNWENVQDFLCYIADGSKQVLPLQKQLLEKTISIQVPGFTFKKVRQISTKLQAKNPAEAFARYSEAAKVDDAPENHWQKVTTSDQFNKTLAAEKGENSRIINELTNNFVWVLRSGDKAQIDAFIEQHSPLVDQKIWHKFQEQYASTVDTLSKAMLTQKGREDLAKLESEGKLSAVTRFLYKRMAEEYKIINEQLKTHADDLSELQGMFDNGVIETNRLTLSKLASTSEGIALMADLPNGLDHVRQRILENTINIEIIPPIVRERLIDDFQKNLEAKYASIDNLDLRKSYQKEFTSKTIREALDKMHSDPRLKDYKYLVSPEKLVLAGAPDLPIDGLVKLLRGEYEYKSVQVNRNGVLTAQSIMIINSKPLGEKGGFAEVNLTYIYEGDSFTPKIDVTKKFNNAIRLEDIPAYQKLPEIDQIKVRHIIFGITFDGVGKEPLIKARQELFKVLKRQISDTDGRNPFNRLLEMKYNGYLEARNSKLIMEQQRQGKLKGFMGVKYMSDDGSTLIFENLATGKEVRSYKSILEGKVKVEPKDFWIGIADIISNLREAHAAGIYHMDIKPHNLVIGPDNKAKIIDFGTVITHDDATKVVFPADSMGKDVLESLGTNPLFNPYSPSIPGGELPLTPAYYDSKSAYKAFKGEKPLGSIDNDLLRKSLSLDLIGDPGNPDEAAPQEVRDRYLTPPVIKQAVEDFAADKIDADQFEKIIRSNY